MRTPEENIKQAILFTEEEVRLTAVAYFAERHCQNEAIMPVVIQAVEKYGRDNSFSILRRAEKVPQTEDTVNWLVSELSRDMDLEDVGNDNYCCAAALILQNTPPGMLVPGMADLPNFPEELRPAFFERLEMAAWNWDQGWDALEDLAYEAIESGGFRMRHTRRAKRIVEALALHPEHSDEILRLVHRCYREKSRSLMDWLEPSVIELAGTMGLREAIPILVERLHEDDLGISDSAQTALQMIGTDEVVKEITSQWTSASGEFRQAAAEVMGHIHTDRSVKQCLEFLTEERNEETRNFLAHAALDSFAIGVIEPVRQMVLGEWDSLMPDERDLRCHLLTAATIMETSFLEYEQWYAHAVNDRWGSYGYDRGRIRENLREDIEEDEDDWDEGLEEDYEFEGDGSYLDEELPGLTPFRHDLERAGRNDPCPCGSGKKFKKCCLKQSAAKQRGNGNEVSHWDDCPLWSG
jgi:2-hydroxy-3-keto-5-methylthiopentenyl-1-phosphate phosphatase